MQLYVSFLAGVFACSILVLCLQKQPGAPWWPYLLERIPDGIAAAIIALVIGCAFLAGVLDRVLAWVGVNFSEKLGDVPISIPLAAVAGVVCDLLARITIIPKLRAKLAPKEQEP